MTLKTLKTYTMKDLNLKVWNFIIIEEKLEDEFLSREIVLNSKEAKAVQAIREFLRRSVSKDNFLIRFKRGKIQRYVGNSENKFTDVWTDVRNFNTNEQDNLYKVLGERVNKVLKDFDIDILK